MWLRLSLQGKVVLPRLLPFVTEETSGMLTGSWRICRYGRPTFASSKCEAIAKVRATWWAAAPTDTVRLKEEGRAGLLERGRAYRAGRGGEPAPPFFRENRRAARAHELSTMTTTGLEMRSNKPVNMDIDQLRGWASIMDKAMIASLVATILAVAALGTTTFLSFRYSGAIRAHEQAALDRYKGVESQAAQREQEASAAREQAATLERAIATERDRTAKLERRSPSHGTRRRRWRRKQSARASGPRRSSRPPAKRPSGRPRRRSRARPPARARDRRCSTRLKSGGASPTSESWSRTRPRAPRSRPLSRPKRRP